MYERPFFSICIPQYNRAQKLMRLLKSASVQTFKSYEICISDGMSNDISLALAKEFLDFHEIKHKVSETLIRRRYDENLRNAISIASGKFSILMGNDDYFYDENTLMKIYDVLSNENYSKFGFLVTNFQDLESERRYMRVGNDLNNKTIYKISDIFRSLSFVSGLVFNTENIKSYASSKVDGSEMYQMYLAARSLSNQKVCRLSSEITVKKDPGDGVLNLSNEKFPLPMSKIPNAIAYGLGIEKGQSSRELRAVIYQLYLYIYPYWMYVYKKSQTDEAWSAFTKSIRPSQIEFDFGSIGGKLDLVLLNVIHCTSLQLCKIVPNRLFLKVLPLLHRIAKRKLSGSVKNK